MTTLANIVDSDRTLNRSQLKADKGLVREIQIKLGNLGLYPGGQWVDGQLGDSSSFSWKGLKEFCHAVDLPDLPSEAVALNAKIAKKLLETKQLPFILNQAQNTDFILQKLTDIQQHTKLSVNVGIDAEHQAFLLRTVERSPLVEEIANYPKYLAQKPDGTSIISGGDRSLSSDYPTRGQFPDIDSSGLNFLPSYIAHACVCIGNFGEGTNPIKTHWLGKQALEPVQFLSATKFIGVLNTISQINAQFPDVDIDSCVVVPSPSPDLHLYDLVAKMVSYEEDRKGTIGYSNEVGALFKRFTRRENLESWMKAQTGNSDLQFRGGYGFPPLIDHPKIRDVSRNETVLSSPENAGNSGNNLVSTYDLTRLISMLGWHLHLTSNTRLPDAQWKSLERVVRAMGNDIARYVDVALETLGVLNVISEPVVISKSGWGNSAYTYVALVKFVDRRFQPAKLRTFAMSLWTPEGSPEVRDTHMAAAVTEIVRRVLTEELV
ncbi:hypothetical protein V0288_06065 [Pannus brasiliensis CCIBt3594]|uniref:Uncharacterized protein n=1 Tax=Pannus brasiliensis CCIBt3594 TaxID=1427578 RepID=A0AAW9QFZ9_9CHRO